MIGFDSPTRVKQDGNCGIGSNIVTSGAAGSKRGEGDVLQVVPLDKLGEMCGQGIGVVAENGTTSQGMVRMGSGCSIDSLEQADQLGGGLACEDHDDGVSAVSAIQAGFLTCIGSGDIQWEERTRDFIPHLGTGLGGVGGEYGNREQHSDKASASEHRSHLHRTKVSLNG
jgi:hypothetical protein